jgi:hypothetical protein
MTPALTPWFPEHTHPEYTGYYDTRVRGSEMILYWDGDGWRASQHSPSITTGVLSVFRQNREWRGLTAPASGVLQ